MERLTKYFVPEKYILDLKIDKNENTIGGTVKVFGEAKADVIKFHAVNLNIKFVKLNNKIVKHNVKNNILEIEAGKGKCEVEIEYDGTLNENMQGAYLSTYEYNGKKEIIVATQFESHYAREAFPCIDEPEAKAVFELAIMVDGDNLVLSNTPVKNVVKNTTFFEPTPRMSTYLLAWVIGRFHGKTVKNAHGIEITTYAALNHDIDTVDFANEIAAKSLEFYDDNFGVPYPLKKLDQVALPDFEAGAMENWGLVTYRESMLLADRDGSVGTKKSVALTVAHELSHQWFGDLVTMKWWDDLWLNESFASVMEYYAVDYAYPEFSIFDFFYTREAMPALWRDALSGVQSVHQDVENPEEIATLFDPAIVYAKGARLMQMLIRAMGWENFTKGIKDYFEKYQYNNTVGDDLWNALNPYADFDPYELMHAFIDKPGFPVITDGTQKRFLLDNEMAESDWPIPEVKGDMSGHYIINLTEDEFNEKLADFDNLSLEEKLRLLIDRDLLAKTSLVSSASLLPLIKKFENENNAVIWDLVVAIVGTLKIYFQYNTPEEKMFKKFVGELADRKLKEIGLVTKDFNDMNEIRLRSNMLALKFYAEDKEVLKELAGLYDENYEKMDVEVRDDILDAKIFLEPEMVDKYIFDYQKIAEPELKFDLLFAATLSRDAMVINKMVELLEKPEIVKPQDHFHLFIYEYRNPAAKAKVWEWLTTHWDYVKKITGDKSLEDYPRYIASSIKTKEDYEKYHEFFGPMADEPALKRAIEVGENEIKARLKLIEEDQKAVWQELANCL